ncbi:MAG: shikimate dehydrogenase [Firmicutes bacterium]|nr:shikimate dehydrogenase [Bacillota bacterium]
MDQFAFLVHPLSLEDVRRRFRITRHLSDGMTENLLKLCPPLKLSEVRGVRSPLAEVGGFFIALMLTTRQILQYPEPGVVDRIVRAGRKAERLGAGILGLGAYTSTVGDGGIQAARRLDLPVTTGNSLTAATAIAAVVPASRLAGIDLSRAEVVVIGTGGTGCPGAVVTQAALHILEGTGAAITLLGRDQRGLTRIADEIEEKTRRRVKTSTDLAGTLRSADVVLVAAGASERLIPPEAFRPGAIVCDIARPRETSQMLARCREDILAIDGGLWEVPGDSQPGLLFGLPPRLVYPCVAETMLLAMERRYEDCGLGKGLDPDRIVEMYRLALKHGFRLAELRLDEKPLIPPEFFADKK